MTLSISPKFSARVFVAPPKGQRFTRESAVAQEIYRFYSKHGGYYYPHPERYEFSANTPQAEKEALQLLQKHEGKIRYVMTSEPESCDAVTIFNR